MARRISTAQARARLCSAQYRARVPEARMNRSLRDLKREVRKVGR